MEVYYIVIFHSVEMQTRAERAQRERRRIRFEAGGATKENVAIEVYLFSVNVFLFILKFKELQV